MIFSRKYFQGNFLNFYGKHPQTKFGLKVAKEKNSREMKNIVF